MASSAPAKGAAPPKTAPAAATAVANMELPDAAEIHAYEKSRVHVLKSLSVLDSTSSVELDLIADAARQLFGAPIGLISLVDSKRQWFKSNKGLEQVTHIDRRCSFCSYTVLKTAPTVMMVPDAFQDPRFCNNPMVTGPPFIRFYIGVALIVNGFKVGSLSVMHNRPRLCWPDELIRLSNAFQSLGKLVVNIIVKEAPDSCPQKHLLMNRGPGEEKRPTKRARRTKHTMDAHVLLYETIYNRIPADVSPSVLNLQFSDKELRVLMRENKIIINILDEMTGKYVEKTKAQKIAALFPMVKQLVHPDIVRRKAPVSTTDAVATLALVDAPPGAALLAPAPGIAPASKAAAATGADSTVQGVVVDRSEEGGTESPGSAFKKSQKSSKGKKATADAEAAGVAPAKTAKGP